MIVISENSCNVSLWEGCSPAAGCRGGVCRSRGRGGDRAAPRMGWPCRDCLELTSALVTGLSARFTGMMGQEG